MHEEELKYIEQLNDILRQYRYEDRIMMGIVKLVGFAIVVAVYYFLGFFGCIIFLFIIMTCLDKLGFSFKNAPIKKEELAYHACDIMKVLIDIKKGTHISYDGVRIAHDCYGKNKELYREFIDYYPAMASRKLKSLASVNIPSRY